MRNGYPEKFQIHQEKNIGYLKISDYRIIVIDKYFPLHF